MTWNFKSASRPPAVLLAAVLCVLGAAGCAATSPAIRPLYPDAVRRAGSHPSAAFVSDTQSPLWFEKLILPADDNERATRLILAQIAGDSSCAALFHLGDITSASSEEGQWETFDAAAEPLRKARIPISPAFGNHEYLFVADEGVYNAETRFPVLRRQWYVRRVGPMAVILLNSNFSRLTQEECLRQEEWYERSLDSLDADSSVAAVVVGCHHPPYTNSRIASPSEEVQREFLPAFFNSRKAKLFLSGHAHTFEHFVIGKKDFLVIGGGGGLLHPLLPPGEQRWPDQFPHAGERSFFHYLRVRCGEDRLSVEVMALDNTSGTFSIVHRLEIVCAPR